MNMNIIQPKGDEEIDSSIGKMLALQAWEPELDP